MRAEMRDNYRPAAYIFLFGLTGYLYMADSHVSRTIGVPLQNSYRFGISCFFI